MFEFKNWAISTFSFFHLQFLPTWVSPKTSPRRHRRSSSYPVNFSGASRVFTRDKSASVFRECQLDQLKVSMQSVSRDTDSIVSETSKSTQITIEDDAQSASKPKDIPLKTWNSLPTLLKNAVAVENSAVISSSLQESDGNRRAIELAEIINVNYSDSKQPVDLNVDNAATKPKTPVRKTRSRTKARHSSQIIHTSEDCPEIVSSVQETDRSTSETWPIGATERLSTMTESTEVRFTASELRAARRKTAFLAGSAPEFTGSWSLEVESGQKDIRTPRKSFMEDGGSSVQPMATGYFPRPAEGQSLTSFLSSARFSRAHDAELDRENAHFSVCEAMIAAIEQIKCNRVERRLLDVDAGADDESDEEINRLKQRIRLRRRQRQEEKCRGGRGWSRGDLLSDGRTDTTTTDQSVSPLSTSTSGPSDSVSTDDAEDSELEEDERRPKNGGVRGSVASSLHSDAELRGHTRHHITDSTLSESSVSAEGVALSLISRFSEKQLPRASELQWLVSEKDAPQRLLPMPKSWPVSPDEIEIEDARTIPLRGTIEWAPPRPQIIFTLHPPPM